MEFSDLYKQTNSSIVQFSPDGRFIAVGVEHRLIVRDSENPKRICRVFSCPYQSQPYIEEIQWSGDSQYLMTASYKTDRVDVWSLEDENWRCSIVDEAARIANALWAPNGSQYILTLSELGLRLSIWSLVGGTGETRRYIQLPKGRVRPSFHPDGDFMALAQRREYRDLIGIYSTDNWQLVKEIEVSDTVDLDGLQWSPDGLHLAGWDSAAQLGAVVVNVAGVVKRVYGEKDSGLGLRLCRWSPTGQLLAMGGYDGKIRVLNNLTWRAIGTLYHPQTVAAKDVDVFSEVEVDQPLSQVSKSVLSTGQMSRRRTRFDLEPLPAQIHTQIHHDPHRAVDAKHMPGVSWIGFNAEGTLMASQTANMPNALWIWRTGDLGLVAVIQTMEAVRQVCWSPLESTLAFVTGTNTVYLWKQDSGCHLYEIPSSTLMTGRLCWNPNGVSLGVLSKGLFSLAFIVG